MKLSLASKITGLFAIGLALITSILISFFSSELNRRYCDLFIERGQHSVNDLLLKTGTLLELGLYPNELVGYDILLNETINKTEGILYLAFLDSEGEYYFQAGALPIDLPQDSNVNPISMIERNEFFIQLPLAKHFPHAGSIVAILDSQLIEQKTMEFVNTTLRYAVLASFLAILGVLLYLRSNLGEPLKRLVIRIQQVDLNADNQDNDKLSERFDEVGVVARTFDTMLSKLSINQANLAKSNQDLKMLTRELEDRVEQRTKELENVNRQLQSLAHVDTLTGLLNRHCLEEVLQPRFENAKRNNHLFAILMMDLDRFKTVNDKYGHAAGDKTLSIIGERFRSALRYGDRVFRYGGDEFVLIFEDYPNNKTLITIIEKIKKVVLQPVFFEGNQLDFGLSIGVASNCYCTDCTAQQLIVKADQAMYAAKKENLTYVLSKEKLSAPPKDI